MAATIYGEANFGLSAQTGLYIADFGFDVQIEEKLFRNHLGVEVGGQLYNPTVSWSMSGVLRTDEVLSSVVGAAIVLANVPDYTDFVPGYTTGGVTYLLGAKSSGKQDDFQTMDLNGKFMPFMTA